VSCAPWQVIKPLGPWHEVLLDCLCKERAVHQEEEGCANLPPVDCHVNSAQGNAKIHQQLHWVPPEEQVYQIMDNAGGHGMRQASDQYTKQLKRDYNITIMQQSASSPEVNALDLGVWMSVQAAVKERHRNRHHNPNSLAETVQEAWNDLPEQDSNYITADC
jgi:hypothetical protein